MARKVTKKIAFLGLGRMGGLMTKHLIDAGFPVTGYDPAPQAVATAKKNGAKTAKTVAAAVKDADVVCSSLPSPAVVRSVYLGSKGVLETARRGAVCFELSTSTVSLAKEIAEAAKKKRIAFLDAPVSGSIPHLERKEVAAIVGGDQAALKEHRDVLDAFSKSITYMGKSGNGLIMKLVTNHILNIHHSGMAEGLAFGMKAGLTAPRMMKFLQDSVIPLLIHYKGTTMAARDYSDVIANLGISFKDLGLSINEANDLGAPVPLGAAARQQYTSAMALGLEDADFNAVFEAFLNAMGTRPKRK
ncbi:MAG: NAD(P)-dependent oxidoreductase [Nitrospinae bacterium]|nr:NAD(P)-dependent oxidoreductase [Nitrospinota bacterium]